MKTTHGRRTKILWGTLVAGTLALASTLALAQDGHGPHGRRGFGNHRGPGGPLGLLRELDLSDEQRQQVRAVFEEAESNGAGKRLMDARGALNDAIDNGADEGELRELAYQVGQFEGDAAIERARAHARINEILTEPQRLKLAELKKEAKEKMAERQKRFEERRNQRNQGSK